DSVDAPRGPIVSARHSSFPRAWSPNEARWGPHRRVIPELLLDRTALRGRQQPAHRLDKTLIARGRNAAGPMHSRRRGNLGMRAAAAEHRRVSAPRTAVPSLAHGKDLIPC